MSRKSVSTQTFPLCPFMTPPFSLPISGFFGLSAAQRPPESEIRAKNFGWLASFPFPMQTFSQYNISQSDCYQNSPKKRELTGHFLLHVYRSPGAPVKMQILIQHAQVAGCDSAGYQAPGWCSFLQSFGHILSMEVLETLPALTALSL